MKFVKLGDGWIQLEAVAHVAPSEKVAGHQIIRLVSGTEVFFPNDEAKKLIEAIESSASIFGKPGTFQAS